MANSTEVKSNVAQNGRTIEVPSSIAVRELADLMGISPIDLIKELMGNGIMANINQQIDFDTVSIIGEEMGFEVISPQIEEEEILEAEEVIPLHRRLIAEEDPANLKSRPPVVTVLGHVDHGKTTLLDAIRHTQVVKGEFGGITQHIGAYQAYVSDKMITFLDTPGHAAFTAMRARGAQATDLAVLVVAADDGVMPQTREAVEHARAAGVPILIALNKTDKDNANPEKVKQELANIGLVPEDWGGDTVCVPLSATVGSGIEDLLENILLITDVANLQANPDRLAQGMVIESKLDKQRGASATLLVQNGTLKMGDTVVINKQYCRIRAMFNDRGKAIKKAGPSVPVSILGLSGVPQAGDFFEVVDNERTARTIVEARQDKARRAQTTQRPVFSLEEFFRQRGQTGDQTLRLILKVDVQGSMEPIVNSLKDLGDDNLKVKILLEGTGNISESDVSLAVASGAIILGFNVQIDAGAEREADAEGVDIRRYTIIYKLIDDIDKALKGLLEPEYADKVIGHAVVRAVFKLGKHSQVAGSYIIDGHITRNALARVIRNQQVLHDNSKISSLKRFQEDVREVATGFECGIGVEGFNNFAEGDVIEAFVKERIN